MMAGSHRSVFVVQQEQNRIWSDRILLLAAMNRWNGLGACEYGVKQAEAAAVMLLIDPLRNHG